MKGPAADPAIDPILEVADLRLALPGHARPVLAGVNLTVRSGETVALVGESGSGKSLTARAALGLLPAGADLSGSVRVAGDDVLTLPADRLRALRSTTASMIFQDPRSAMNPLRRLGDFLTETVRGTARADGLPELLDAVGLPSRVLRQYPHELSGGMLQRVMIAAALLPGPRLLLADEPTTALDTVTQAEIIALLARLRAREGCGLLFVTHDLELAAAISDRVYVMYAGRIVETGPAAALFEHPRHPYTRALLDATPRLDAPPGPLPAIPGRPPDLRTAVTGCAFAARCARATDLCGREIPAPRAGVACHHGELPS
ncbi:ABC transporter ATP-binding protein [Streptomyces sp. NBC_00555]|uniref:ABC transporter ATP-binding protein n=1 Tax=Streptomyces sp. NBC_00555 TaxID=2903662 RepID=UPI002257AFEA|nr:ABC transporter ATP-binding protein [Streptomyces sp. NBC_00555]MCX5010867.1 ABC transporter ATP-binding protein [Streptomyces sp. NBC_00555]